VTSASGELGTKAKFSGVAGTAFRLRPMRRSGMLGVAMKTAKLPSRFHVVVEAADCLSVDEQETLVAVLNRRLADRRRAELAEDVREGRREFKRGALRPTAPDKIMKEILS
jgi:hypothetical protein